MSPHPARLVLCALSLLALVPAVRAKITEWKDAQGHTFKAEPTEILGPFAVFKTSATSGRKILLRELSPDDCRRFYQEISHRAPPATTWTEAKGSATRDVIGRVQRVQNHDLVNADLTHIPEPPLLLVLFGSHNDGESWQMVGNFTSVCARIERVYPGLMGTVFMGVRHSVAEHKQMAVDTYMPWLVADFREESAMTLSHFAPAEGPSMVLVTREGVPLIAGNAANLSSTKAFIDQLTDLLWQINPANNRLWKDRAQYYGAVRPLEFAHGHAEPLLIGNPLRPEGLRQRGISRVEAKLDVAADGKVSQVEILPGSVIPDAFREPLADALKQHAVLLPAIDNGASVAGNYSYVLDVPPEDKQLAADTAWLTTDARLEVAIASWLVLKPVHVTEQDFFEVDHVAADGKVVAKSFEVSTSKMSRASQMNSFSTDWFAHDGAASVHPAEGEKQMVDGTQLTWHRIVPKDGFVDFQDGLAKLDYCIGYAWTEIESPADLNAWLGIGSDDGIKIWFNGELVHDKWVRRTSRIDDDVVPLHLKKGRNQLLVKIQNAVGDWSFITRMRMHER